MSNEEVLLVLDSVKENFEEFNKENPDKAETGNYICEAIGKAIEDLKKYYNVD